MTPIPKTAKVPVQQTVYSGPVVQPLGPQEEGGGEQNPTWAAIDTTTRATIRIPAATSAKPKALASERRRTQRPLLAPMDTSKESLRGYL